MKDRVAVIDVGSNSIKALVAEAGHALPGLRVVFEQTLEVRISQGIGGTPLLLREDRISAGVEAVNALWKACRDNGPLASARIVATSAIRSAANGHRFTEAVRQSTGLKPAVLSGEAEADAIAAGVRTDPRIGSVMTDFTVFDLGGGSLELIRFGANQVILRTSLPLGAVRITESLVDDPARPLCAKVRDHLATHVRKLVSESGVLPEEPLIGCSGGLAALRGMLGAEGAAASESGFIDRETLLRITERVCSADLGQRKAIPGMPPERADIFPAAMITFLALLDLAGADGLQHSTHNLRYGIALRLLEAVPSL